MRTSPPPRLRVLTAGRRRRHYADDVALLALVVYVVVALVVALVVVAYLAVDRAAASSSSSSSAICRAFGPYCGQALRVAYCESRLQTTARNGQYVGLFQMGADERRRYGDGADADAQARAAYRYFVAAGYSWRPWTCKP